MSTEPKEQGNTGSPNSEEAFLILRENCQNFLKMSQEEKSEGIKINYLLGLIKLCDNLKIDSNTFITTIFDEILFKDLNILKNRNILSNFISILESKKNPDLFEKKFFLLLTTFGSDYNTNSIYFHQYLIDISLYYIFNSSFKCPEKTNYISLIIENDIKPFETQLLKNIINKNKKLIDENENKILMVKCLYNKFISMNKYKSCLIIFTKILENVNNNYKRIPKEIIFELIKSTNNIGFNHVIKKTKEINDFLIFNCLLLDNLDEKLFVSEEELEMLDIYLINILNLLSLKKDLNIDIFQKIYNYYNTQKYKNLNKVFLDVLYYLSTYSYSNSQYEFLFNCLNSAYISPIYNKLITNHLLLLNKKPLNYKENNTMNKNLKFVIIDDDLKFDNLNDDKFILDNSANNISFLNHLNLYYYIINSSFTITKNSRFSFTINFYPKILNRILILLNNLSLENSNKKFFEELLMLLLDLLIIIINFYISIDKFIFNEDYLINSFLKIIEKSSVENKYSIIFPSFINLIKSSLIDSYEHLNDNSNDNKLYNLIFDCLISNFSNNNNMSNNVIINNNQQIILMFKSLIILFFDKKSTKIQKKFFALDKLIDLVLKSNNSNVKLFESFYKLCGELQKSPEQLNKHLSNYSLNKFSKNISNINESFRDYIIERFKEIFISKRPNNIPFDENTYFVINTISNIYNNESLKNDIKLKNLNDIIDDFCGTKLIIGVLDCLFMSIETNECDIKNIIDNGKDIYSNYNNLNKVLNNLDYYIYIYDNYFDNNIQNNKNSMCHYGILKSLAHLLSGYLSNCINKSLNESNSKENISVENKKDNKINQEFILDYIKNKVLFNQTIQNTSYPAFFINYIFRDKNVLHYFIVHYTNYTIKKYMENNKDQSLSEVNLIIQEMTEKNRAILNYIQQNPYFILLMKDIINSFIEFDLSMLNPNNSNYLKKTQDKKNYKLENIVSKLGQKGDKFLSQCDETQKIMINSFFSKMLLDEIFEKNNPMITFENNQIIFLFLLDNSILDKYLDFFGYFVNIDYSLVQLYALIRKASTSVELNEKYISFIYNFIEVDNFNNYIMRILSNKKTFNNLFKNKNINNKYIVELYGIVEKVMNNLSNDVNEDINIGGKLIYIFNEILEHINNLYSINSNLANTELYLCGKLIKLVLKNLKCKNNNKPDNKEENNNSNVIDPISSTLEQIYSLVFPKYAKIYYNTIFSIFDDKKSKIGLEYSLDNIYLCFNIVIDIISGSNKNNKYYEILSSKVEPDIMTFFSNLLLFNKYSDYLVNNNFSNFFTQKFIEHYNNNIYKKFLQNLYLYALFKGKLDEKNLKSVIIEFFGDFQDNQIDEDIKQLGYLTCYFLSSIKKDNNTGNKNNYNNMMNFGDFSIISSIGERFKEDEKSLQKKTPNQINFNK